MKCTKAHGCLSWITGKGKYQEAKFDEDAEKIIEYYRNKGYIAARVGQPEIKILEDSDDKETRWVELQHPDRRGPALPRRRLHVRRQQGHQDRVPRAALQAEEGRLVLRQADSQRPDQGARDVRQRRLLRVHRLPGSRTARRGRGPGGRPGRADRQRHDAHEGRRAVLRQPPDLRRQHHDARQRDSPRGAPRRRRRRSTPRR